MLCGPKDEINRVCVFVDFYHNLLFSGESPADYKDLKPNNPNIKVDDGTLAISNIQKTNEGYYLCEAVNGIGSGLSAVIFISVQG